jgi:hypothetical protein
LHEDCGSEVFVCVPPVRWASRGAAGTHFFGRAMKRTNIRREREHSMVTLFLICYLEKTYECIHTCHPAWRDPHETGEIRLDPPSFLLWFATTVQWSDTVRRLCSKARGKR